MLTGDLIAHDAFAMARTRLRSTGKVLIMLNNKCLLHNYLSMQSDNMSLRSLSA